MKIEKIMK